MAVLRPAGAKSCTNKRAILSCAAARKRGIPGGEKTVEVATGPTTGTTATGPRAKPTSGRVAGEDGYCFT